MMSLRIFSALLLSVGLQCAVAQSGLPRDLLDGNAARRRSHPHGLVIPKGAVARGRLRLVERENEPSAHFIVGVEFTELEFDNRRAMFYAKLDQAPSVPGLHVSLEARASRGIDALRRGVASKVCEGDRRD